MLTIHKYAIPIADEFTLDVPAHGRFLCVQTQKGAPQLWALVNTEAPKHTMHFALRGTGHDCAGLDSGPAYLGTWFFTCSGRALFSAQAAPIANDSH